MIKPIVILLLTLCVLCNTAISAINSNADKSNAFQIRGIPIQDTTGIGILQQWYLGFNSGKDSLKWYEPTMTKGVTAGNMDYSTLRFDTYGGTDSVYYGYDSSGANTLNIYGRGVNKLSYNLFNTVSFSSDLEISAYIRLNDDYFWDFDYGFLIDGSDKMDIDTTLIQTKAAMDTLVADVYDSSFHFIATSISDSALILINPFNSDTILLIEDYAGWRDYYFQLDNTADLRYISFYFGGYSLIYPYIEAKPDKTGATNGSLDIAATTIKFSTATSIHFSGDVIYNFTGDGLALSSPGFGSLVVLADPATNELSVSAAGIKLAQQSATPGQVLKWNGSKWAPAADDSTGGGGTEVFIEGTGTDSINFIDDGVNINLAYTADGDGGAFDTVAISLRDTIRARRIVAYSDGASADSVYMDSAGVHGSNPDAGISIGYFNVDSGQFVHKFDATQYFMVYADSTDTLRGRPCDTCAEIVIAPLPIDLSGALLADGSVALSADWAASNGTYEITGLNALSSESLFVTKSGDTNSVFIAVNPSQDGQLIFRDSVTGTKTLAQLATGGSGSVDILWLINYETGDSVSIEANTLRLILGNGLDGVLDVTGTDSSVLSVDGTELTVIADTTDTLTPSVFYSDTLRPRNDADAYFGQANARLRAIFTRALFGDTLYPGADSTMFITSDASGNMIFRDTVVGATKTLTQLLAGSTSDTAGTLSDGTSGLSFNSGDLEPDDSIGLGLGSPALPLKDFYVDQLYLYIDTGSGGYFAAFPQEKPTTGQVLAFDTDSLDWLSLAFTNITGSATDGQIPNDITITGLSDSTNWNTAYGWGDHASGGYLKANGTVALSDNWAASNGTYEITGLNALSAESLFVVKSGDTNSLFITVNPSQNGQLIFRDSVTGTKTLAELSAAGGNIVLIESNSIDTVDFQGANGIKITFKADGDGGAIDTGTVEIDTNAAAAIIGPALTVVGDTTDDSSASVMVSDTIRPYNNADAYLGTANFVFLQAFLRTLNSDTIKISGDIIADFNGRNFEIDASNTLQLDSTSLFTLGDNSAIGRADIPGSTIATYNYVQSWINDSTPQIYGELYENNGTGSDLVITTAGTYYGWTTATQGSISYTTTNVARANGDAIIVDSAGVYTVDFAVSFGGTAGTNSATIQARLYTNNSPDGQLHLSRKLGSTSDVGSASFTGLVSLSANDTIDVRFTSDGSNDTIKVYQANLNVSAITNAGTAAAIGETNTASNLAGNGIGVWKDKVVSDLRFKRLIGDSSITVADATDSITFTLGTVLVSNFPTDSTTGTGEKIVRQTNPTLVGLTMSEDITMSSFSILGGDRIQFDTIQIGTDSITDLTGYGLRLHDGGSNALPLAVDTTIIATQEYADLYNPAGIYLPLAGGTMSSDAADINMADAQILNVETVDVDSLENASEIVFQTPQLVSYSDGVVDLGTSALSFGDLYAQGVINFTGATSITIDAGDIAESAINHDRFVKDVLTEWVGNYAVDSMFKTIWFRDNDTIWAIEDTSEAVGNDKSVVNFAELTIPAGYGNLDTVIFVYMTSSATATTSGYDSILIIRIPTLMGTAGNATGDTSRIALGGAASTTMAADTTYANFDVSADMKLQIRVYGILDTSEWERFRMFLVFND